MSVFFPTIFLVAAQCLYKIDAQLRIVKLLDEPYRYRNGACNQIGTKTRKKLSQYWVYSHITHACSRKKTVGIDTWDDNIPVGVRLDILKSITGI